MIPKACKRLAEVDFPIAEVSRHAAREKSIRHGHPSTLHLWWARRPLASSRAVLMALLLPDPCDPQCPEAFRKEARRILLGMHGRPGGWTGAIRSDEGLRRILLKFIADFADWDHAADRIWLDTGRALVRAAHGEGPPLVVDPFAGGGSIPLEALRLGCEAFASDLNPVACLILKVMLEDVPRHGPGLADELRRVGGEIRQAAERELAGLYPADLDGSTPIAYLWARTVLCEAPSCGAEIPLLRSLWLAKKAVFRRERGERIKVRGRQALRYRIVRAAKGPPRVEWEVFEPATDKDVRDGTVTRAKAACPCCGAVLPPERVRVQLSEQRGGADMIFDGKGRRIGGARMTAVVTLKENEPGRRYRLPTDADYAAVHEAQARLAGILDEWERGGRQGLCPVPDEPISLNEIRRISVPIYGMTTWGDLFTARQKVVLVELLLAIRKTDVVDTEHMLACAFNRISMSNMSCTRWNAVAEKMQHTFGRQALPIVWDFAEIAVTAEAPGNWKSGYCLVADVVDAARSMQSAQTQFADAIEHPLPDEAAGVWFTDPPYYDAVPYAHLSDFFFVWLKRAVPEQMMTLCNLVDPQDLTPKEREIVVDRPHRLSTSTKTAETYESGMARAFTEGRRILHQDGIGSVVFAHKTTEGWEALLTGIISGGWTITGSWPVATEMGSRLNARDTASLATSVHLVCRPRPDDAPVGDWADVLRELPRRVGDWMERLQGEGVRGADLVFACIGPALEIFSRYSVVETPEGAEVRLPVYLERVWEVVGRTALETVLGAGEAKARNGQVGALEEDARLTALFLWTLQSTEDPEENDAKEARDEEGNEAGRGLALPFDVVRRFAQPMGIDLDAWTDRIIGQDKGVVRLLPVLERAQRLFGEDGAGAAAEWIEADPGGAAQLDLFPSAQARPRSRRHRRRKPSIVEDGAELQAVDATTLDRVHAAMLLQASGHANALRTLIAAEQERGPDFLRLANSLSALYSRGSEEKRLLDAMLLAVPR